MEKPFRQSDHTDKTLFHIGISICLAFIVMLFVNAFIGGTGGLSVFVVFFIVFYAMREKVYPKGTAVSGTQRHEKKELFCWFRKYAVGFVLLWILMRIVGIFGRINGWAGIDGMTIVEYLEDSVSSRPIERWAYFVVGVLMLSYILSLFPLVFIRKKKAWVLFLLADHAVFSSVCGMIAFICRFYIVARKRRWGTCVYDDLLLCSVPKLWLMSVLVIAGILFLACVAALSYRIAVLFYYAKDEDRKEAKGGAGAHRRRQVIFLAAAAVVVALSGVVGYYFFGSNKGNTDYVKVASCLTDDSNLGPMQYRNKLYVPIEAEWEFSKQRKALGYLGYKGQDCDSRFYELVIANILYYDKETGRNFLQMDGADFGCFEEIGSVEEKEEWKRDDVFLLWDEDWLTESRYSSVAGYAVSSKALIAALKEQYPKVEYRASDFEEYDAYFTIRSYPRKEARYDALKDMGHWCGCILVKDNRFYFGSYENPIEGISLELLLDTLGGYGQGPQEDADVGKEEQKNSEEVEK